MPAASSVSPAPNSDYWAVVCIRPGVDSGFPEACPLAAEPACDEGSDGTLLGFVGRTAADLTPAALRLWHRSGRRQYQTKACGHVPITLDRQK